MVYIQSPSGLNEFGAPNRIKEGDVVDVHIKQNPKPEELQHNKPSNQQVNTDDNLNATKSTNSEYE